MGKCYSHINKTERTLIKLWHGQALSIREIARRLGRHHSSISRELRRNLWCGLHYYIRSAQMFYERRLRDRAKRFRLKNQSVRDFVHIKLKIGWTPELIAGYLRTTQPNNFVCHESIYQYIYIQAKNLISYLPRKHATRRRRFSYRNTGQRIKNRTSVHERTVAHESRTQLGHWESDSLIGGDRQSGLNVVVERATRLVNITRLKARTAIETKRSVIRRLKRHPEALRRSITYDNGSENVLHDKINEALHTRSYFCEPYHSWEKGSVEQINGLIRRFFPKGTVFKQVTDAELNRVEKLLNNRPRKCLNFRTPYEVFRKACGALPG